MSRARRRLATKWSVRTQQSLVVAVTLQDFAARSAALCCTKRQSPTFCQSMPRQKWHCVPHAGHVTSTNGGIIWPEESGKLDARSMLRRRDLGKRRPMTELMKRVAACDLRYSPGTSFRDSGMVRTRTALGTAKPGLGGAAARVVISRGQPKASKRHHRSGSIGRPGRLGSAGLWGKIGRKKLRIQTQTGGRDRCQKLPPRVAETAGAARQERMKEAHQGDNGKSGDGRGVQATLKISPRRVVGAAGAARQEQAEEARGGINGGTDDAEGVGIAVRSSPGRVAVAAASARGGAVVGELEAKVERVAVVGRCGTNADDAPGAEGSRQAEKGPKYVRRSLQKTRGIP
ncbi:hypothetical protein KFL_001560020 [Klebsormidium nitens]|uniref:Uncharacterized protein n=1 Tax=Klebsormidium nitens TaxID=105231 RepID=A0A1Y1I0Z0_KLENI|nr:hypothetical protein KFL_001560020 [Klebsormidium nitens]|eukprot:GAQ83632.1 hypothetical protein KFL_001560020 [Klebsormidium nitens]